MTRTPASFRLQTPERPQAGVPRRFGVRVLIILMAVFATLLGVLRAIGVPLEAHLEILSPVLAILLFVAGIVACQAFLFKGKNPRAASILAGSGLFYLLLLVYCLTHKFERGDYTSDLVFFPEGAMVTLIIGGVLGYLVGGLIAGLFLVCRGPAEASSDTSATDEDDPTLAWLDEQSDGNEVVDKRADP